MSLRDDLMRFVSTIGKEHKCSFCGNDRFALLVNSDPNVDGDAAVAILNTSTGQNRHFAMYGMTCMRCGYMHHFTKSIVDEWIVQNSVKPSDGV
jgi:hypothetical protein